MDSRKLELLLLSVKLGSFTKAAEEAGYTQSGLTHMMDSLEREAGFPLLVRGHGGVTLTEQGEALLPAVRALLQADRALEKEMEALRRKRADTIRIAAYPSMAMHWLPEILYRFRRICPEISAELRMVDHALEPYELLEAGEADVIFASRQPGRPCRWTPLYREPLYAILPKSFPLEGDTFPLKNFEGLEFLMPYGRFDIDVSAAAERVGVRLKAHEAKVDDETVVRMVGKGLGVSMLGELMIRGSTDDVRCVPVDPPFYRELGMGTRAGAAPSEGIRRLTGCVEAFVSEQGR